MKLSEARRVFSSGVANRIANDSTRWALFQNDVNRGSRAVGEIADAEAYGTKHGTGTKAEWAIAWWQRVCEVIGTDWLRDDPAGFSTDGSIFRAFSERESVLQKAAALELARKVTNNIDKAKSAKPATIKAILWTARAALVDLGCAMPQLPAPRKLFNSITKAYVVRHGQLSLIKKKKQVIAPAVSKAMLVLTGAVGNMTVDWDSVFWVMIGAMYTLSLNSGMRKCALTAAHSDDLYIMLANVSWYVDGTLIVDPTPADINRVADGDIVRVIPPAGDKTDAYGDVFGTDAMYFRVNSSDPLSCANWLLKRERLAPSTLPRRNTPLFSPDGSTTPFTASFIDTFFTAWISCVVGPAAAVDYTWHCCRATLASELALFGSTDEMIQVFCRWRSPTSVAEYRHLTPDAYADTISAATQLDATATTIRRVITDDDDAILAIAAEEDAEADEPAARVQRRDVAMRAALAATPLTGRKRPQAQPPAPRPVGNLTSVDLGDDRLQVTDLDPRNIVGSRMRINHSAWPGHESSTASSWCRVVGLSTEDSDKYALRAEDEEVYLFSWTHDLRRLAPSWA